MSPRDRGPTDEELELFCRRIEATGLDPLSRQIYVVYRYNRRKRREEMSIETSIDGLRTIAERTGRYLGRTAPVWCGEDAAWRECWPEPTPPVAAKVGVYKRGAPAPSEGVAHFAEYNDGKDGGFYARMPRNQLAVRAEAQALRAAFPGELSGLYVSEEMPPDDGEAGGEVPVAQPPGAQDAVEAPTCEASAPPGGGMRAVAGAGPAAPAQLRKALREALEAASLSGEAVAKLAGLYFSQARSDRLSEEQMRELTELVEAIGAGEIAEGTLKGQLTRAEGQPDRVEAKAAITQWILACANGAATKAEAQAGGADGGGER